MPRTKKTEVVMPKVQKGNYLGVKLKVTFLDEVLGTCSADPNIHEEFIASKAPDAPSKEEEVEALGVDEVTRKATTVFPRNAAGDPGFWNYQWRGYFKEACSGLRRVKGSLSEGIKAYKKIIDLNVFVPNRFIPIVLPEGTKVGSCQRSLRAETAQGPRISLANSETVPAGSTCEFWVLLMNPTDVDVLLEWMSYGMVHGTGQWRNSGKGIFTYSVEEYREIPLAGLGSFTAECNE